MSLPLARARGCVPWRPRPPQRLTLRAKFPNQLGGREPMVRRTDLGAKGIYYRAMVGPFAAIVGEQSSVMVIDLARTHRTDGRARLSISLDEAVAPCSFQCAAHSSRLFH